MQGPRLRQAPGDGRHVQGALPAVPGGQGSARDPGEEATAGHALACQGRKVVRPVATAGTACGRVLPEPSEISRPGRMATGSMPGRHTELDYRVA
ncbi:MAG: hypothetical protein RBR35_14595 [Salinivirgaceae bacterium]|nr:hypothetical protein [Salinivirgaceae bacterium]